MTELFYDVGIDEKKNANEWYDFEKPTIVGNGHDSKCTGNKKKYSEQLWDQARAKFELLNECNFCRESGKESQHPD